MFKKYTVFRGTLCHDFLRLFCIVRHLITLISKSLQQKIRDILLLPYFNYIKSIRLCNKIHIKFVSPFIHTALLQFVSCVPLLPPLYCMSVPYFSNVYHKLCKNNKIASIRASCQKMIPFYE